jgi:hypothetical protein
MFPMVASATSSNVFQGPASVAALWASLPDLPPALLITSDQPEPIFVQEEPGAFAGNVLTPEHARLVYPYPRAVHVAQREGHSVTVEQIRALLVDYPTISGVAIESAGAEIPVEGPSRPLFRFRDEAGRIRSLSEVADLLPATTPSIFSTGRRYVIRPRLGTGNDAPPSQLMVLWAFVYALSQLARYHPALWVGALNPDSSPIAVDLEQALDVALDLVPDLLVPALSRGAMPRLLRERQAAERERERSQQELDARVQGGDDGESDDAES